MIILAFEPAPVRDRIDTLYLVKGAEKLSRTVAIDSMRWTCSRMQSRQQQQVSKTLVLKVSSEQ